MLNQKSFIYFFVILFFVAIIKINVFAQDDDDDNEQVPQPKPTAIIKAQPVEPKFDNKLVGEWWTDSKDAIFAKIVFETNGVFTGYNLSSDIRPYATGTYRITDNGIEITANEPTMGVNKPTASVYKFVSYTVTGNTLQLLSDVTNKAYNYYRSPANN